jgi:hypothetical protein
VRSSLIDGSRMSLVATEHRREVDQVSLTNIAVDACNEVRTIVLFAQLCAQA